MQTTQNKMRVKEIGLVWLVVDDFEKALHFYTEVLGLNIEELNKEYGWAELSGFNGGARLGIAKKNDLNLITPGQNAVVTLTVENLIQAKESFVAKGGKVLGEIIEVPGHVKLLMIADKDNNHLQLAEML